MGQDAATIPVIVGVGQVNDRPDDPALGLDSLGLMAAALRAADEDGGGGWLAALDALSVVNQISCPWLADIPARLAEALGARPRICEITATAHGDYPIRLLDAAANRIAAGAVTVAAIVGGEALRTASRRAAAAAGNAASSHSAIDQVAARAAPGLHARFGLVTPTDVYPLYENAGRAAYGQTLDQAQAETGAIWSRFSEVAAGNDGAWLRKTVDAAQIRTPSADNAPGLLADLATLRAQAASRPGEDGATMADDALFMTRLARAEFEAQGLEVTERASWPTSRRRGTVHVPSSSPHAQASPDALVQAARLFASGTSGAVSAGTGPNMSGHSNVAEYFVRVLTTLAGFWLRVGETIGNPGVMVNRGPPIAASPGPFPATGYGHKMRIRGLEETPAGLPTARLAEEILMTSSRACRALPPSCGRTPTSGAAASR